MRTPIVLNIRRYESVRFRPTWRQALLATTAMIVAVAAAASIPSGVSAHDNDRIRPCGLRTLRGDFGLLASGTRLVPFGPNAGKTELVVGTGLRNYDGSGGFTESGADLHGQLTGVTSDPGGIAGTYEVNPDCTGRSTRYVPGLPFPIISNFVIVGGALQVKEAVMEPGPNVITVVLDRRVM
jgi:hypothetical protein